MTLVNLEKNPRTSYSLKISQSIIIYVNECFHMFFSTLKDTIQAQNEKKIIALSKSS